MKKNKEQWSNANGVKALEVDGAVNMNNSCRYSIARYDERRGVFELYAFFDIGPCEFNEGIAQRRIGPELKRLFNAERYICIATQCTKRRASKDQGFERIMGLEFYAKCQMPEPCRVGAVKDVVKNYVKDL